MKIQQVLFDIEFGNQNNCLNSPFSGHSYSSTSSYEPVLTTLTTTKSVSTIDYPLSNMTDSGLPKYI